MPTVTAVDAGPVDAAPTRIASWWSRGRSLVLRHRVFSALVVVAILLRIVAMVAYRAAFMFYGDSYWYIASAQRGGPLPERPFLYPAFLRLVSYVGDISLVVAIQHVAGIVIAVAIYAFLRGRGAPAWLAILAALPPLFDAYVIQLEHHVLAETMFTSLLVGAALLIVRRDLAIWACAAAGALLAAATVTRSVGAPLVVVFGVYLLIRRAGWKRTTAFVVGVGAPLFIYAAGFSAANGSFGGKDATGRWLYGRVITFADCNVMELTAVEQKLCDERPPSERPNANFYIWSPNGPVRQLELEPYEADQVARSFAIKAIKAQPGTFVRYVLADIAHYFAPGHPLYNTSSALSPWQFPDDVIDREGGMAVAHNDLRGEPVTPVLIDGPASFLQNYQSVAFVQGPILLVAFGLGIASPFIRRGRRDWDGALFATSAFALIAFPSATVMFDYRYLIPAIPLFCIAGGLGALALLQRRRDRDGADDPHQAPGARPRRAAIVATAVTAAVVTGLVFFAPLNVNHLYEAYAGDPKAELGWLGPAQGPATDADLDGVPASRVDYAEGTIIETLYGAFPMPEAVVAAVDAEGGFDVLGPPTGVTGDLATGEFSEVRFTNGTATVTGDEVTVKQND